jgi:Carbohydrate family 9 binding domain-like
MIQPPRIEALYSKVMLVAKDFAHPEWTQAHPIHITHRWSGDEAPASRHAEVRIIWTEESLLVRFVCHQEEPLTVNSNPQVEKKTMRLWDKDVCEIFLAPDLRAPDRYFEFEVAPTGEWIDLAISFTPAGRETNFEFHSGMTAAAIVGEGQTIIAMRIPWSRSVPKPRRGDVWRANLFRCVGVGDERYLAWRPTFTSEPNFHVPEVFGWLDFV